MSQDNLDTDIVQSAKDRKAPTAASIDAEIAALAAAENAPAKPTGPTVPAALQPLPPKSTPGFAGEAVKALAGGVRDAAQNTLDLGADAGSWLNDNLLHLRGDLLGRAELPKVAENQTTAGKAARGLTQFVVPFLGAAKVLKGVGMANTAIRGMTAGAVTDAAAFDPHEKRVSNMVMEMSNNDPLVGKAIFEYLAANPADGKAEGRFKNAVEGTGLGLAVEGIFKGIRMVKNHYYTKGEDPVQAVQKAHAEDTADIASASKVEEPVVAPAGTPKVAPTVAPKVEAPVQAATHKVGDTAFYNGGKDSGEVTAIRPDGKVVVRDDATGSIKAVTPDLDDLAEGAVKGTDEATPVASKPFSRPEVANVAPIEIAAKRAPSIKGAQVSQMVDAAVKGDYKGVTDSLNGSDFNFNHIDTEDDIKGLINEFSSVFEKEHSLAKHGKQTFDQTQALAEELGAGKESLKQMFRGTDNLAARVLAHRSLLAASAEKVGGLAKMAMSGDAEAILALRKHVALHASIQAQMKGVQTEIARSLSQFRITAKSVNLSVNERNQLIEAMGGHKVNMDFAQKLSEISDPKKLNAVVRGSAMARSKDALFEAWINGLLSGPATHVVNAIGNSLTAINSVAERLTASMVGKVLRTGPDAIPMGEAKAQMFGMMEGFKDAVSITNEGIQAIRRGAGQAIKGDLKGASQTIADNADEFGGAWQAAGKDMPQLDSAAFATKELRGDSVTAANFDMDPNRFIGAFVDGLGALVRLPGRALTTSDELFKTIHYRGELKAQAYRMARSEGLEGDALFSRIGALVDDPTPALRAQAMQAAREGTFTTPLGSKGASLQNLVQNIPGARYIMPFVRTPINLMKFVGVRTPGLNMLAESVRNEFKAGGSRRDIMLAKTAMGGMLYGLGATLASQGVITGGGEKDQSSERLGGIQPYSVKVGDKYYAFNRFDPFGTFLGIAADLSNISGHIGTDESDNVAAMASLAISRNLVSKSYLSGLVEFLDTVNSGSEGKWEKFMQRQAASFIPAAANAVRREVDPEVKEIWSVLDAVRAKVPGFSKDVLPLVNIFGEDVHYKGGLGPDIASPIYTSEKSTEPAAAEIARLNLDLRNPPRTIGSGAGAPGIDLTPTQYHRYMKLIGGGDKGSNGFKADVTKMVQSSAYQKLPEDPDNNTYVEAKEKSIQMLYEAHKKRAQAQLIQGDPQLKQAWTQNIKNKGNALSGKPVLGFPVQQ